MTHPFNDLRPSRSVRSLRSPEGWPAFETPAYRPRAMFWLNRKTFSGSYFVLTSTSLS